MWYKHSVLCTGHTLDNNATVAKLSSGQNSAAEKTDQSLGRVTECEDGGTDWRGDDDDTHNLHTIKLMTASELWS